MPVILATQETEIRMVAVRSLPGQIVCKTLSRKTLHKNRAGGVAQGESPEFKTQYAKKKKRFLSLALRREHAFRLGPKSEECSLCGSHTV
jgi:hypothetical protein